MLSMVVWIWNREPVSALSWFKMVYKTNQSARLCLPSCCLVYLLYSQGRLGRKLAREQISAGKMRSKSPLKSALLTSHETHHNICGKEEKDGEQVSER